MQWCFVEFVLFVMCSTVLSLFVVGTVVPSSILVGVLLRYLLRNSERRCFKGASEDCEILVSTTTRLRPTAIREIIHEFTHREVLGGSSRSGLSAADLPPEYSTSIAALDLSNSNRPNTSLQPPVYGSQRTILSVPSLYGRMYSSSVPGNLNALIASFELLPEFAAMPPPPTYEETVRNQQRHADTHSWSRYI